MQRKCFLILIISLFCNLALTAFSFAQSTGQGESITLTTYYPSPYGVYKTLRLFPQAVKAGNTCNKAGEMAYADSTNGNEPLYCDGTTWKAISLSGQLCARGRSDVRVGDAIQYCPSNYPRLMSCSIVDDQAPQQDPTAAPCATSGSCDASSTASPSTRQRTDLGSELMYLETVGYNNIHGCWAYDKAHAHAAYRIEFVCCKDSVLGYQ